MIEIIEKYSIEECKKYPNKIFVFGDNLIEKGTGGQAIIRNEPNSFGIPTKRLPNMMESSFFSDKKDEETRLKEKLYLLNDLFKQNKTIVFPKNGIGTGLAKMQEKSPILFKKMNKYLLDTFGYNNGNLYKSYAGIGSRKTPEKIILLMSQISKNLEEQGYTLRSGGAQGADSAFEKNINKKEIYLPWKNFNQNISKDFEITKEMYEIAKQHHPIFDNLKDSEKKLMARNVKQILGNNLKQPVNFVICWTPDGCESNSTRTIKTGGTGLAISLADSLNIPIYNLKNENSLKKVLILSDITNINTFKILE